MSPSTEPSNDSVNTACGCRPVRANAPGMPITLAKVGERGTIVRISGKEETRKFLAGLGFTVGTCISTVCSDKGNMVLEVQGSRIAVDKEMAGKIMVSPES